MNTKAPATMGRIQTNGPLRRATACRQLPDAAATTKLMPIASGSWLRNTRTAAGTPTTSRPGKDVTARARTKYVIQANMINGTTKPMYNAARTAERDRGGRPKTAAAADTPSGAAANA